MRFRHPASLGRGSGSAGRKLQLANESYEAAWVSRAHIFHQSTLTTLKHNRSSDPSLSALTVCL